MSDMAILNLRYDEANSFDISEADPVYDSLIISRESCVQNTQYVQVLGSSDLYCVDTINGKCSVSRHIAPKSPLLSRVYGFKMFYCLRKAAYIAIPEAAEEESDSVYAYAQYSLREFGFERIRRVSL